jgi:hypothetical protein
MGQGGRERRGGLKNKNRKHSDEIQEITRKEKC